MDPSDEALLAGFATGDERNAAAFVRRYQGRVFGLAMTIVRQPQVAEEVAQEAFARAWRHAGAFDARKGKVSTWLLTITWRKALDRRRFCHSLSNSPISAMLNPRSRARRMKRSVWISLSVYCR